MTPRQKARQFIGTIAKMAEQIRDLRLRVERLEYGRRQDAGGQWTVITVPEPADDTPEPKQGDIIPIIHT